MLHSCVHYSVAAAVVAAGVEEDLAEKEGVLQWYLLKSDALRLQIARHVTQSVCQDALM